MTKNNQMGNRHKSIKTALSVGYASEWNDDHLVDYDIRVDYEFDFLSNYFNQNWDLSQETSGTTTGPRLYDGIVDVHVVGSGTIGFIATMRKMINGSASNVTNKSQLPILNMAIELEEIQGDLKTHEFGLFKNSDTPFTSNQAGIYFRVSEGNLYSVTCDGSTEQTNDLGVAPNFGNYRIEILSSLINFYVNNMNTPVSIHNAYFPEDDLNIKLSAIRTTSGSNELNCQALGLSVLRKQ